MGLIEIPIRFVHEKANTIEDADKKQRWQNALSFKIVDSSEGIIQFEYTSDWKAFYRLSDDQVVKIRQLQAAKECNIESQPEFVGDILDHIKKCRPHMQQYLQVPSQVHDRLKNFWFTKALKEKHNFLDVIPIDRDVSAAGAKKIVVLVDNDFKVESLRQYLNDLDAEMKKYSKLVVDLIEAFNGKQIGDEITVKVDTQLVETIKTEWEKDSQLDEHLCDFVRLACSEKAESLLPVIKQLLQRIKEYDSNEEMLQRLESFLGEGSSGAMSKLRDLLQSGKK